MTKDTSEIRVRAVQRFAVPEYLTSEGGRTGSSQTLCEVDSHTSAVSLAEDLVSARKAGGVAASLTDMVEAEDGNFVIVQAFCYEPETIAYYAQTKTAAKKAKADAEAKHGGEFRIYRAESVVQL